MMLKRTLLALCCAVVALAGHSLGRFGDWTCSVALTGYVSDETGKAPNAYLWVADTCRQVRFCVLAQQNMTEEAVLRHPRFRQQMAALGGALIWVAPWFSQGWSPQTGCQQTFQEMMVGLAGQSGHDELATVPIVPLGHSAQATFPWNFAAWNSNRTLCIISLHGDAPRTNLCGYGTANVEWGRTRNIDGIPGLMIMGEYEWWEARVLPALAFQMMYPRACISFLCDTGAGHFDCPEATIDYMALFIGKAVQHRLRPDGTLAAVERTSGWLVPRYGYASPTPDAAPVAGYRADPHDAFWYFDAGMAQLTAARHREGEGCQMQYVGCAYRGRLIPYDGHQQGGMYLDLGHLAVGDTFCLQPVAVDSLRSHRVGGTSAALSLEYICGPVRRIDDTTFQVIPYDCGTDNPKRSGYAWLAAVAHGSATHKRAVQPLRIRLKQ